MATALENLDAAILTVTLKISEVSAVMGPNYSIDGQSVDKAAYLKTLNESLMTLLDARRRLGMPWEVRSAMRT